MEFIQAFPLILIFYGTVAGSVISLMTASPWPLVLSVTVGWILAELRDRTNSSDSWKG